MSRPLIDGPREKQIETEFKRGYNTALELSAEMVRKGRSAESILRKKYKDVWMYEADGWLPVREVIEPFILCDRHRGVHKRSRMPYRSKGGMVLCGVDDWRTLWVEDCD